MNMMIGADWEPAFIGVRRGEYEEETELNGDVVGWRRKSFGIYVRHHPPNYKVSDVAYLVHLASGLGLGAFRSRTEAAHAALLAEELADWTSPLDIDDADRLGDLAERVRNAWHRAGFYYGGATDADRNFIWYWGAHAVGAGIGQA